MTSRISRADVIAFRAGAHHLVQRLDSDGLLTAAGRCGVQNSPPGSALLALHARVRTTRESVAAAVDEDKILLQTWCMRGSPFVVPARDAAVFTTGVLPPTDAGVGFFVRGVQPALDRLGMSLADAVGAVRAEITGVLSGRRLAIDALGKAVAVRVASRLPAAQRHIWQSEGPYARGQPLGEGVVHFCIRVLALEGIVCFASRAGRTAPFVLVEEWLGRTIPAMEPDKARAELLRRYLRSYGPSTRAHFAAWLGVRVGDTDPWWSLVEDEMWQVEHDGPAWILADDLDALRSSPAPTGVRLLPPHDPYTQMRDRHTILDPARHQQVYRPAGGPGTVLVAGQIAGTWRARTSGRRLAVTVSMFDPLTARHREVLQCEAEDIARVRGASTVAVVLVDS